jgi:hypothetical protein
MTPTPRIYGKAYSSNTNPTEVCLEPAFEPIVGLKSHIAEHLDSRTSVGTVLIKRRLVDGTELWTRLSPTQLSVSLNHDQPMRYKRIPKPIDESLVDISKGVAGVTPTEGERHVAA